MLKASLFVGGMRGLGTEGFVGVAFQDHDSIAGCCKRCVSRVKLMRGDGAEHFVHFKRALWLCSQIRQLPLHAIRRKDTIEQRKR
jgi:hypothetical protein